jgi:hypothetical protein
MQNSYRLLRVQFDNALKSKQFDKIPDLLKELDILFDTLQIVLSNCIEECYFEEEVIKDNKIE